VVVMAGDGQICAARGSLVIGGDGGMAFAGSVGDGNGAERGLSAEG